MADEIAPPLDSTRYTGLVHLASGSYGIVLTAQDAGNGGKEVVIKKIPKSGDNRRIRNEIVAHQRIPQTKKGLVKYHGYFESRNSLYLVFDRVKGDDLYSYMERHDFVPLSEAVVTRILRSALSTLSHCHSYGVAHRDIKLENIIVDHHLQSAVLIDFGLCSFFPNINGQETPSDDFCGSLEYIPPEIIHQTPLQASKTDSWALGITAYCLLFGQFPYTIGDCLSRGVDPYQFESTLSVPLPPNNTTEGIFASEELRHLVSGLLRFDPTQRISVSAAANHPILTKHLMKKAEGLCDLKLAPMIVV